MEYRQLGNSNLHISAIGFGCGNADTFMDDDDDDKRIEVFHFALQLGINYFDTAAKYFQGNSEINLGRTLRALDASPIVSTKIVLDFDDLGDPRSAVLRLFDESLGRLGMDTIGSVLLHNRVHPDPVPGTRIAGDAQIPLAAIFGPNGVAAGLEELQREGRVASVGFAANHGDDPQAIAEMIKSGAFNSMNADLNLLNPSASIPVPEGFGFHDYQSAIPKAQSQGMGVVVMRAFAGGQLFNKELNDSRDRRLIDVVRTIRPSMANVAVRYVLAKPGVTSTILGFCEKWQIQEAVDAANDGPLDEKDVAMIEQIAISTI